MEPNFVLMKRPGETADEFVEIFRSLPQTGTFDWLDRRTQRTVKRIRHVRRLRLPENEARRRPLQIEA